MLRLDPTLVPAPEELGELEAAIAADAQPKAAPLAHVGVPSTKPTWSEFVDSWDLFADAVMAGAIAGLVLGFLSVYVVVRRMVFLSAAVTQAAGLGVALSFYVAIAFGFAVSPSVGASVLALATSALVGQRWWSRVGLSSEMVLGLAFVLASAAAVMVGSRITQESHDIAAILFGSAVVVEHADLHGLELTGAAVMVLQLWWFRGFCFASFDPVAARVQRLPVGILDLVLLVSIAMVIAQSARAIGALPTFALSTLPGIAAALLGRGNFFWTFVLAAVLGLVAGVGGYILAFLREFPVGPTQATCAALMVVVAAALRALGAFLGRRWTARTARTGS